MENRNRERDLALKIIRELDGVSIKRAQRALDTAAQLLMEKGIVVSEKEPPIPSP